MGNAPSPLRKALRWNDVPEAKQILDKAGDGAERLINEDYSADCILQSCSRAQGNAFMYAVAHNRLELTPYLIEKGADIYTTGQYGEGCLHCAARHGYVEMAQILIQAGCDVHATDDQGRYPIHSCAMTIYNTSRMIGYLLETVGKREDVNLRDFNQRTPLHEAAFVCNIDVVQTLLNYGADVNAVSKEGNTPLHGAHRSKLVWELLIQNGADENVVNKHGMLPNGTMAPVTVVHNDV